MDFAKAQPDGSGRATYIETPWGQTAQGKAVGELFRQQWRAKCERLAVRRAVAVANKRMRRRLRRWSVAGIAFRRQPQRRASRAVSTRSRAASTTRRSRSTSRDDGGGSEPGPPGSTKPHGLSRPGRRAHSLRVEVAR